MATTPVMMQFRLEPPATWDDPNREFLSIGSQTWEVVPDAAGLEPLFGPCVVNGRTGDGAQHELKFWDEATRTLTVFTWDD